VWSTACSLVSNKEGKAMKKSRGTIGITLIIAITFSFSLTIASISACGGTDTDKTPKKDSKDSTENDNDQEDENYTLPITYEEACKKCKGKDGACADRSEMPSKQDLKDHPAVNDDKEDKSRFILSEVCNCKNTEANGLSPEESSCNNHCEQEKEIEFYSWDCPNAHEHSDFYVNDVLDRCRLQYDGEKPLPNNGDGAYLDSPERDDPVLGGWLYEGGDELKLYYTQPPDYESLKKVTCTGECIKPEKCGKD